MKVGDIVYLNSGSPMLTVVAFSEGNDTVYVSWMGVTGSMVMQPFPKACLSTTNNPNWVE